MITVEQKQKIFEDIKRMIPHLARTNGVHNDDIIKVMSEVCMSEIDNDDYKLICWPECQTLLEEPDAEHHMCLANDIYFLDTYGGQAYFAQKKWLNKITA